MPPDLESFSKPLLGGIWTYEIYRALTDLFDNGKDEVAVGQVHALTNIPDKETSVISKHLATLAQLGLLVRIDHRGHFRRVEDQFWISVAALVHAWEHKPPQKA